MKAFSRMFLLNALMVTAMWNTAQAQWVYVNVAGGEAADGIFAKGDTILVSTRFFKYRSTNGGSSWTQCAGLLNGSGQFASIGPNFFFGTQTTVGVYISSDAGLTWSPKTLPNSSVYNWVYALTTVGTTIVAGAYTAPPQGGVYRSTDNGTSWTQGIAGLPSVQPKCFATAPYGGGTTIFMGCGAGLYRSTDSSSSWSSLGFIHRINSLAVIPDGAGGASVFAAAWYDISVRNGIYRTTNNGTTWVPVGTFTGSAADTTFEVNALYVLGTRLIAQVRGANSTNLMYLSSDYGATWTDIHTGMPTNIPTFQFAATGGTLFAGTSFDVYKRPLSELPLPVQLSSFTATLNSQHYIQLAWTTVSETNNYGFYAQKRIANAPVWTEIPNGFIAGHGTTLEPHRYSFVDASVSPGHWEFRLKQVDLDGSVHCTEPVSVDVLTSVSESSIPRKYELMQNYPNPFNPTTVIKFKVPGSNFVTLKVYDLLGKEVATLVNENLQIGSYETTFNAGASSSGVYLYRLQAGSFIQTKKLVVAK